MADIVAEVLLQRKYHFKRYKETKDKDSLEFLIFSYMDTIKKAIESFCDKGIEYDELINIAVEAAIIVINNYDDYNLTKLSTYFYNYISYSISKELKQINPDNISYEEYIKNHKNGEEETYYDSLESQVFLNSFYDELKLILSERELKIISLRFGLEDGKIKTLAELGEIFKCSHQYMDQTIKKILYKLSRPYNKKKIDLLIPCENKVLK